MLTHPLKGLGTVTFLVKVELVVVIGIPPINPFSKQIIGVLDGKPAALLSVMNMMIITRNKK